MFNGHMDTSYSGREPHLRHIFGFQPEAVVKDGRIYGLGISNMKGALACYLEAVRAVRDAGVRLQGRRADRVRGGRDREDAVGRGVPRRASTAATPPAAATCPPTAAIADMCILGEPTEQRVVLGHYGTMWARISTHGPVHPHRVLEGADGGELDRAHARGARRRARVDPGVGAEIALPRPRRRGQHRLAARRASVAGEPHPEPHRPVPRHPGPADDADAGRQARAGGAGARAARQASRLRRSSTRCSSPRRARRSTRGTR